MEKYTNKFTNPQIQYDHMHNSKYSVKQYLTTDKIDIDSCELLCNALVEARLVVVS